ncbi:hypothetical protein C1645_813260 [Glomus cerebriforme]|uniref:Uncharacterized protein n=1 Tax=Glomus cerebriforme TaxID=658196 RepID=A0A397TSI9_9GLOM|nr:hypothetical protein C1645_813260 [Glomus cerebriforme]
MAQPMAGTRLRSMSRAPPSNINSTKSKYSMLQLHTPTSNSELSKRPSSHVSIAKPSSTSITPVRLLSQLASLSELSKTSYLKKPRPQSIAVRNTSINNTTKISTDSLSSHDEYSASSMIFTPPESPTGASKMDSLTSLTSSVSYGSSPGRATSPIPPHNTATSTRL